MRSPQSSIKAAAPQRLPRAYEYVCLYLGLGFLGLMCLLWTPFAAVFHALLPKRLGTPLGRRVISGGFHLYLRWLALLGACRFDVGVLDELRDAGPLVLAPNHPCLLDAVMVISRLPDVACIMKASLMNNLFLGGGARLAGYIRNEPILSMVRSAVADLKGGSQLLIFPEGTRTVHEPINPCLPTAAVIASRAKVPVQIILIETDSAYLAKGWPLFRRPAMPIHYRVRLGKRIEPQRDTAAMSRELEACLAAEVAASAMKPPPAPAAQS